jgi:hypothetical protein
MKKYFTTKSLAIAIISIAAISCQKDNGETSLTQSANANAERAITGQAIGGYDINGLITEEAGEKMRDNFGKSNKNGKATEYVAFAVKDLSNYLAQLKTTYKSDSVYVSFGIYDDKTAVNKKDVGRVTIFFVGKNKVSKKGNIRSQDEVFDPTGGSNYFNHGSIWP